MEHKIVALEVALWEDHSEVIMGEIMALNSHKTIENMRLLGSLGVKYITEQRGLNMANFRPNMNCSGNQQIKI